MTTLMLQTFKKYIQSDETDSTFDNSITSLLERAQTTAIIKLGYSWVKTAVTTELHDPKVYIYPKYLPILATPTPVVSLNSVVLTSLSDYWRYDNYFYIPYLRGVLELPQSISLAYTGGYNEAVVADLEKIRPYWQLVFEIACHWQKTMQELTPQTFIDNSLPKDIEQMINDLGVPIF